MFPIFISHGPAFKRNYTIDTFKNVDIYPLMCFILGIQPGVNNGTLNTVLNMIDFKDSEKEFELGKLINHWHSKADKKRYIPVCSQIALFTIGKL